MQAQRKKRERRDGHRKGVHKYRSKKIDYEESEDPDIAREKGIVNILFDSTG